MRSKTNMFNKEYIIWVCGVAQFGNEKNNSEFELLVKQTESLRPNRHYLKMTQINCIHPFRGGSGEILFGTGLFLAY